MKQLRLPGLDWNQVGVERCGRVELRLTPEVTSVSVGVERTSIVQYPA